MSLSICVTTYNRPEMTIESFKQVLNHPNVSEIIISDDASEKENQDKLTELVKELKSDKIKLSFNPENLGMSRNKAISVELASNDWCVLLDSDNVIDESYINKFVPVAVDNKHTIACPVYAKPDFDFIAYSGRCFWDENAKVYLDEKMFRVFLNCCNYVVPREKYLEVYQYNPEVKEADTIWFNYLWLKSGGVFLFMPGMTYYHRKHEGSGWLKNHKENIAMANRIQELIKEL